MITDLRDYEPGTVLTTDVCVIGGGPAGITLALGLAERGIQCALLESGGEAYDDTIQTLFETESSGTRPQGPCRLRYLGGASNHWGGYCTPLNPIDFEQRDWVPHSGWPIGYEELKPFYRSAQTWCRLGARAFTAEALSDEPERFAEFEPAKMATRFYQQCSPPVRFGTVYRERLTRSERVQVYLHANVTELVANESASAVTEAQIRTVEGWTGAVRARTFVLACGGIENARLLLLSDSVQPNGLGNHADAVGRYFMQHPHVGDVEIRFSDPARIEHLSKWWEYPGVSVRTAIGPSAEAQRGNRILNCCATLHARSDPDSGYAAASKIWYDLRNGKWPDDVGDKLWAVISDLDEVVTRAYHGPRKAWVRVRSEQVPDPDSRITLSAQRDRLGQRRAHVHWRLNPIDKRTIRTGARLIGEELGRLGHGRVRLPGWLVEDDTYWPEPLWGGCHHMGTTRMSDRPEQGVVDANCRVHGIDNLYIAGSSVFPTGGFANPTLTIVALAVRLSEHLAGRVAA